MLLTRRFLLFAPAVVTAANLMPIRALAPLDPLVKGILYQSWPFDGERDIYYWEGYHTLTDNSVKPLSYFLNKLQSRHGTPLPYWKSVL